LVMKTLEAGWYIVINAYNFTVFDIWGAIFVLSVKDVDQHFCSCILPNLM